MAKYKLTRRQLSEVTKKIHRQLEIERRQRKALSKKLAAERSKLDKADEKRRLKLRDKAEKLRKALAARQAKKRAKVRQKAIEAIFKRRDRVIKAAKVKKAAGEHKLKVKQTPIGTKEVEGYRIVYYFVDDIDTAEKLFEAAEKDPSFVKVQIAFEAFTGSSSKDVSGYISIIVGALGGVEYIRPHMMEKGYSGKHKIKMYFYFEAK